MKEVCLELIKAAKDRLKYPIITIYIIVLILWNWDVLSYYFLSSEPIKSKINYIGKTYYDHWGRVLWPLLKAIILAIIVPGIMLGLEYILYKINNGRREIRFKHNEAIRLEKLKTAQNEFLIEQERSGKKTSIEWQERLTQTQELLDLEKANYKLLLKQLEDAKNELRLTNEKHNEDRKLFQDTYEDEVRRDSYHNANMLVEEFDFPFKDYGRKVEIILEVFDCLISRNELYVKLIGRSGFLTQMEEFQKEHILPMLLAKGYAKTEGSRIRLTTSGYMVYEQLKNEGN